MRIKTLLGLWLPLAVSFELMMLEGPTVQAAMGRLPDSKLHLAAWGLTMALALLVESPVIMLLATTIALVQDESSYRTLRRFMLRLLVGCTFLTALVAFTPLFNFVAHTLMGQPAPIVAAARPALRMMLLWAAAIGLRRFYQGILVGHGRTRLVTLGTVVRLATAIGVSIALAASGRLPGVQVGAIALMTAVIAEAVVTSLCALPIVRREVVTRPPASGPQRTQAAIWKFHLPLAATTVLMLMAQPITTSALARLDAPRETLAVWPVAASVLLVMRGWGLALQEITVALWKRPDARSALSRFSGIVGSITTLITALIACTPLLNLYLSHVVHLSGDLWPAMRRAIGLGCMLPLVTALGAWARGVLVAAGRTTRIYQGMGINLTMHVLMLLMGIGLHLPGIWVAVSAYTFAGIAELVFLFRQILPLHAVQPEYAV